MAQSVILVRLTLGWEDVGAVRGYVRDMQDALHGVDGFQGGGAWQGVQDPHARLILFSYASPEAAGRGLVAIGDLPSLIERQQQGGAPADVKALVVLQNDGLFEHRLPDGMLVSMSVRVAEPGYGPELVDDYDGVFGGLSMIPGYSGSLVGVNTKMRDEVVGLVAWRNDGAFQASMPEDPLYEVVLYEPVGED